MILSQDAKTIFNGCNRLRGAMMAADKFETRHINKIAAGEQIHSFIVAPATAYSAATPVGQKIEYQAYGVYAVDEKTLKAWQEDQTSKLGAHFNSKSDHCREERTGLEVLPTHSAAHEQARHINQSAYNKYLQDYQAGHHAGIEKWEEKQLDYRSGAGATLSSPASLVSAPASAA